MTQETPKQKVMFFALAHDLGYDAVIVKERAKQHFELTSFNDSSTQQLGELIDRLLERKAAKVGAQPVVDHSSNAFDEEK